VVGFGVVGLGVVTRRVVGAGDPSAAQAQLDRLARSLTDARNIVEELTTAGVKLNIGGSVHDPTDPVGRQLFNVLAMIAEFESDLIRMRTREGMKVARPRAGCAASSPSSNPRRRRTS
jgi:DNA invertase Pin-like site-specific DNA recombinase